MGILKILFISIISMVLSEAFAQNLVKNSSFEKNVFDKQKTVESIICSDWFVLNSSTPDYYSSNSIAKFGVPMNYLGFHPAHTGNCYLGFIPLAWDGYMEHITGTLNKQLEKDSIYYVSFYLRYAGSSSYFCASNLGVFFSNKKNIFNSLSFPYYEYLLSNNIRAHVKTTDFVTDTSWAMIEGIYKAKGNEKYLTLGIFYEEEWELEKKIDRYLKLNTEEKRLKFYKKHNNVLKINENYKLNENFPDRVPYYFIDDLCVRRINSSSGYFSDSNDD